jgi:TonB family protein
MITHGFLVEVYERLGENKQSTRHCLAIGRMTPVFDTQNTFPVYRVPPEYPSALAKMGREGWALVEFTISPMGFVENPVIIEASNEGFNNASLEAIKKWRYAPKFVEGKTVPMAGVRTVIRYQMGK